jgi:hypothetical protein
MLIVLFLFYCGPTGTEKFCSCFNFFHNKGIFSLSLIFVLFFPKNKEKYHYVEERKVLFFLLFKGSG